MWCSFPPYLWFEFDLFAALTFLKKKHDMRRDCPDPVVVMAATFQAEIRLDSPVEVGSLSHWF